MPAHYDFFKSRHLSELTDRMSACLRQDFALVHGCMDNARDVFEECRNRPVDALQKFCRFMDEKSDVPCHIFRHALDQFYALVPCPPPCTPEKIAESLLKKAADFNRSEAEAGAGLSLVLGLAKNSGDAPKAPDALFYESYAALEKAKAEQQSFCCFRADDARESEAKHDRMTAGYIRNAMDQKRLRFAYQPIIDCRRDSVAYYECLIRLVQDDYSLAPAGLFIPVAERMGFVDLVDSYVCNLVLQELRDYPDVTLAINISTLTIQRRSYFPLLEGLKDSPGMAERLILEITESGARDDIDRIVQFMKSFQDIGCRIALDDFGVGHTSFAQLLRLPVDIIKVDGKFVRGLFEAPENKLLIETVINYSKHFKRKTVAEFVENTELAHELLKMDVDYLQGNYFRPAANNRLWLEDTPMIGSM
jgi:EAL domain-containing protein (putative c-di-GMP-specific phosphodiesterase class I)